jgi:hypothetical protein
MKTALFSFLLLFVVGSDVCAQRLALDSTDVFINKTDLQFVPDVSPIAQHTQRSITVSPASLKRGTYMVLSLLEGIKYASPIDRFHSLFPFDNRAYEAMSVSDLNHHSMRYQFIQSSGHPFIWQVR